MVANVVGRLLLALDSSSLSVPAAGGALQFRSYSRLAEYREAPVMKTKRSGSLAAESTNKTRL